MDKKEIIARLYAEPNSLPTLVEVDFIMEDNKKETLELSKKILGKADECHAKGEESSWHYQSSKNFFDLEEAYRTSDVELWDHHNKTETEWLQVRENVKSLEGGPAETESPEEFYIALLKMHDESRMTKH
jgi:hypothetical protein